MSGSLAGLRVVNTRAVHQAEELDVLLRDRGAIPVPYPSIAIDPPADASVLDEALDRLCAGLFDWLVLTSSNSVQAIASRLQDRGVALPIAIPARVAAVGPATAEEATRLLGMVPSLISTIHYGASLVTELPLKSGTSVFLPGSEIARPEVAEGLRQRGANVTSITVYRTVTGEGGMDVPGMLAERQIDALSFCSPSAVEGLVCRFENEGGSLADATMLPAACIGPTTLASAQEHGFALATGAKTHTLEGLIAALDRLLSSQPRGENPWH